MDYPTFEAAVRDAAGIRLRLRLQPMYGPGEIVFPSTVSGGRYLISPRRIKGYEDYEYLEEDIVKIDGSKNENRNRVKRLPKGQVPCAIIDSVQSQANRMEEAIRDEVLENDGVFIPHVATDFSSISELVKPVGRKGKITCFDAPHRVFDAILRDSVDPEGKHFPFTEEGQAAIDATSFGATPLFKISPSSLLFGSWDSTGISGGLGEKYTRCVVSELVAINCKEAERAGTRIDPLNSEKNQNPTDILAATNDDLWKRLKESRSNFKKPSEINHSSVPWGNDSDTHGGVTCDYIQQTTTVSFPALRRLHFPVPDKNENITSFAARTVLAAIALHAVALNVERGWHLRSRCDLILDDEQLIEWEIVGSGGPPQKASLRTDETRSFLNEAINSAKTEGLPWNTAPITLKPSPALAKLVIDSQNAHRKSSSTED